MNPKKIFITQNDLSRLRDAIFEAENSGYRHTQAIQLLKGELARAEILPADAMPADVITMNSTAILTDLETGEKMELSLCYPESAREDGQVSVLAPIGTAMLGVQLGDTFSWETPAGPINLRLDQVLYQPEAAGVFD